MPTPLKPGAKIPLKIESLAFGNGAGVARFEGIVVFVADAAPGDEIVAEVSKVKKNFAEATILEVKTPSPHRVNPPCEVAGVCGGCSWQHVSYDEQIHQKRNIVVQALSRMAPELADKISVVSCNSPFHYRNRIQLHKSGDQWGFLRRKSKNLVPVKSCFIADEELNALLDRLRSNNSLPKNCRVELLLKPDGQAGYEVTGSERDEIGFSQVNQYINTRLIDHVLSLVSMSPSKTIHDLYAGNGNFSFPLAMQLGDQIIHSVELNKRTHEDAKARQTELKLPNLHVTKSSVEDYLKAGSIEKDDTVILDPPRAGMQPEALNLLAKARPRNIIYVSCDPMTLKRDLSRLVTGEGYNLVQIQAFDMFPQTPHMEIVTRLQII